MAHEHKHEHEHEPGEPDETQAWRPDELDAAGKSLADALRVSFAILKVIMIILVVAFLASGFRTVGSDEKGIVLRFGRIQRIVDPGPEWVFPYPVDELIRVPVERRINLPINTFWYKETREDILASLKSRGLLTDKLNPLQEGYTLTRSQRREEMRAVAETQPRADLVSTAGLGPDAATARTPAGEGTGLTAQETDGSDYNIVHTRWQIVYQIGSVDEFFRNVYVPNVMPGQIYFDIMTNSVAPLLRSVIEDAVVNTMVRYTIDEALQSIDTIPGHVRQLVQQKLDSMETGIRVTSVQLVKVEWPKQVDEAFQAFTAASQKSQGKISEARTYAENTLNEAAGRVARQLYDSLVSGDPDDADERLWLQAAGQVQDTIAQARAYKAKVVETAKANADYLLSLLPEYRKRPELVAQRIYLDALEEVFANVDEKFIVQHSATAKEAETRVQVNRNPLVRSNKKRQAD